MTEKPKQGGSEKQTQKGDTGMRRSGTRQEAIKVITIQKQKERKGQ